MATAGDPVGTGLVSSLAKPGANITGLSLLSTDITAKRLESRDLSEFDAAFAAVRRRGVDAVIVTESTRNTEQRDRIVQLAARHRIPAMYGRREFVDAGGLLSYGPSYVEFFRRAAVYMDKILKGARPAEMPVEQPTKFELVINLKTARALSLTIPPSVLARADDIIQ